MNQLYAAIVVGLVGVICIMDSRMLVPSASSARSLAPPWSALSWATFPPL